MRLRYTEPAKQDLDDLWLYIAKRNLDRAERYIDRLRAECKGLAENPGIGRDRSDLLPGLRSFPVKRHVIYYRVVGQCVEIERVISAYRDVDAMF